MCSKIFKTAQIYKFKQKTAIKDQFELKIKKFSTDNLKIFRSQFISNKNIIFEIVYQSLYLQFYRLLYLQMMVNIIQFKQKILDSVLKFKMKLQAQVQEAQAGIPESDLAQLANEALVPRDEIQLIN
ncbi:hypothetical protein ABPG72_015063 [Tetrahymena utriculariae]